MIGLSAAWVPVGGHNRLEDFVQGFDDVLPRLFGRAPLDQRARDFGDRRDNPAVLIGFEPDRQTKDLECVACPARRGGR
jgi:hypothetical protein